ncbi:hypothetical protein O6H91_19G068400 [Diphasiastrum complanatum]|uniref:Uncharacterized protein n=1 Tax=Diphasiastrum complanatum TaxID=34168 RepID=A0ACC2AWB4_DIPCM|nr:hypothetical protein O6H91_19G068400 [Diphasiastrum complanatum]
MVDWRISRGQLLISVGALLLLAIVAEKSRQLIGDESSSKSGKFSWINCFDLGSGSLACVAKEGVKLYTYNIRTGIVEKARQRAVEVALQEAIDDGLSVREAAKQAELIGKKAGKLVSRKARRIIGPILAASWDFFEALYYGGTVTEASLRGSGTLVGTWVGGFEGEKKLGRLGYLIGSHVGSWLGGRVGLMIYDIARAAQLLTSSVTELVTEEGEPYDHSETL